jgi:hypothetical protein
MSAVAQTASVEVGQLRELLATDRTSAGEARAARSQAPLRTSDYQQPLRVKLRRRWRHDRQLRLRSAYAGVIMVLTLLVSVWWSWRGNSALAAGANPAAVPVPTEQARAVPAAAKAPAVIASIAAAPPRPTEEPAPSQAGEPVPSLSATRRLQRADLWLRVQTPRAASKARDLLESALDELPGSVHGQVALATACLRLGDEACARTAIHKAVLARPWRAKYRALAQDIDRHFARAR